MRAYPVRESGGIVWAYLGSRENMTPFRDFGTEGRDASEFFAMKTLTACNWVQAMEGNIDSAHISLAGDLDYASIRGAEKILQPGEDWRVLGTSADPLGVPVIFPREFSLARPGPGTVEEGAEVFCRADSPGS